MVVVGEQTLEATWETDEFLAPSAEYEIVCRNVNVSPVRKRMGGLEGELGA